MSQQRGSVRPSVEPRWIRVIAFGSAAAVVSFGSTGLACAIAGVYRPYLVFPIGAAGWIALVVVARPILRAPGGSGRVDHLSAAGALAFVTAIGSWNALHASQHVVINRDGGVYANTARWIAAHGTLHVVANAGPFASEHALTYGSIGVYEDRNHVLSFQFAHLLPTVLAELRQLGGDRLMFAAPALLSGIALLALFVAACRFLRSPPAALAAVVAFAFVAPEVSFSRDTVSEIPSQLLLFTALWLLADRRALRSPRTTFVAGLFLGVLAAARIDALLLLVGLPLLFAVSWLTVNARDRRAVTGSAAAAAAGIAPGLVLGYADLALRSTQYLHGLHGNVVRLGVAMLVSILVAVGIVIVAPRLATWWRRVPRSAAWIASAAVAAVGFTAWLVRPQAEHVRMQSNPLVSMHQAAAGVPVDATRRVLGTFDGVDELVPRAGHDCRRHRCRRAARAGRAAAPVTRCARRPRTAGPGERAVPLAGERIPGSGLGGAALSRFGVAAHDRPRVRARRRARALEAGRGAARGARARGGGARRRRSGFTDPSGRAGAQHDGAARQPRRHRGRVPDHRPPRHGGRPAQSGQPRRPRARRRRCAAGAAPTWPS